MTIPELVAFLSDAERLWALPSSYLREYWELARAYSGPLLEARAPGSNMRAEGNVAVISVAGPIDYRPSIFTALFGGAAVTSIRSDFRAALADPGVKAVLMAYDSPGGGVVGVSELANEIMAARGQGKPIIAQIEPMAASAASWLASAADEVVMMPSGTTGALGIISAHADLSGMNEKAGAKVTVVSSGKYKAEGSPHVPLSEEGLAAMQARSDAMYAQMTKDVAAGRKVTQVSAREDFGQGRVLNAQQALKAGLIDRIGTMDETIGRLAGRKAGGMRAEVEIDGAAELASIVSAITESVATTSRMVQDSLAADERARRARLL